MRPIVCAAGHDQHWLRAVKNCACKDFKVHTVTLERDVDDALRTLPAPGNVALLLIQPDPADDIAALAREAQSAGWCNIVVVSDWPDESDMRAVLVLGLARDVWPVRYDVPRLRRAILDQLTMGRHDRCDGLTGARLTSRSGMTPLSTRAGRIGYRQAARPARS